MEGFIHKTSALPRQFHHVKFWWCSHLKYIQKNYVCNQRWPRGELARHSPRLARLVASEGERGPGTRAARRASVRRPTLVHERGGSWALVSEASNDVASPRLACLACLAVYVTYKITYLQEVRLFVRYCPFRSRTHATMDEPQSLLMSPDAFLTPHDSDTELIDDKNTCTTQSLDSTISLPPAPLWCRKPPLPRFLTVSDSDSDSLAKTQPYIQHVGPHPYQS